MNRYRKVANAIVSKLVTNKPSRLIVTLSKRNDITKVLEQLFELRLCDCISYTKNTARINGSVVKFIIPSDMPDNLRGMEYDGIYLDEFANLSSEQAEFLISRLRHEKTN